MHPITAIPGLPPQVSSRIKTKGNSPRTLFRTVSPREPASIPCDDLRRLWRTYSPGPSIVMDPPDMVYLLFQPMYLHARRYRPHPWMRVWLNVSNSVDPHSSPWTAIDQN